MADAESKHHVEIAQWEEEEKGQHEKRIAEWNQKIADLEASSDAKYQVYTGIIQKEIDATQAHEAGMAARRDAIQQLEDRQAYCQYKVDEVLRAQQAAENSHRQRVADMQEEEQGLQKQVDRLKGLLGSLKAVAAKLAADE